MNSIALKITVKEIRGIRGSCELGLKIGDEFIIDDETKTIPCIWAQSAIAPFVMALMYGARFPWEPNEKIARVSCPDPDNTVIFQIEKI